MKFAILALTVFLAACSSRSIKPDPKEVKLSREKPSAKCKDLGTISGTTLTAKGTQDEAIEDLRRDAANKGANYIYVEQFSSYGTTVTGQAYECP
jgi:hypothetical protein